MDIKHINDCYTCPFQYIQDGVAVTCYMCNLADKDICNEFPIKNSIPIPSWCPLKNNPLLIILEAEVNPYPTLSK